MKISEWWAGLKSYPISDVIKHKHRFVVMDTDTFKEKFSFQLSGTNLFVTVGITVIVFIILTSVLIAFTPLRELIPGYTDTRMVEQTYANARTIDSLEVKVANQEWMINAIRGVLKGEVMGAEVEEVKNDSTSTLEQLAEVYRRSKEDSLLRAEVDREDNRYQVRVQSVQNNVASESAPALNHLFFSPLKGKILKHYMATERHLGVDISGSTNQTVNAAYSGTVISANFTADAGYVIAIQHPGNVVTLYRNNGSLLKRQGDAVRAGEPIAYVGNAGSREQGPYLHFEIWVNGSPVNPEEYISF